MSAVKEAKAVFLVLLSVNIPTLGLLALSGWFAYLDNGYWGWPFAFALLCAHSLKSSKDKFEEEREMRIKKAEDIKKYGNIYSDN